MYSSNGHLWNSQVEEEVVATIAGHSFRVDLLPDHPVVVDLGCCRGEFMSEFVRTFPGFERYFAVEANPHLAAYLRANFPDPRIEIAECVVRHISGPSCTFYLDLSNEVNSSCVFRDYNGNPWENIEVSCVSLGRVIERLGRVDLVKMDIEGSEWEILDGWNQNLAEAVGQLTVEFHDFIDAN